MECGGAVDGEEGEGETEGGVHEGAVLGHARGQGGRLCAPVEIQTLAQIFFSRVDEGGIGGRAGEKLFFAIIEVRCGKGGIVAAGMTRGVSVSEQEDTQSHHGVGKQGADGHHVHQLGQVKEKRHSGS